VGGAEVRVCVRHMPICDTGGSLVSRALTNGLEDPVRGLLLLQAPASRRGRLPDAKASRVQSWLLTDGRDQTPDLKLAVKVSKKIGLISARPLLCWSLPRWVLACRRGRRASW
jgi:hypothetical protein